MHTKPILPEIRKSLNLFLKHLPLDHEMIESFSSDSIFFNRNIKSGADVEYGEYAIEEEGGK